MSWHKGIYYLEMSGGNEVNCQGSWSQAGFQPGTSKTKGDARLQSLIPIFRHMITILYDCNS